MTASPHRRAPRTPRSGATATLAVAAVFLAPAPVCAHGSLAVGDFYTGLLQPVFHFDFLLPAVALALWSAQLGEREVWRLPLAFLASAFLGSVGAVLGLTLTGTAWAPHVAMLVLGVLVAARLRLPLPAMLAVGAAAGLAHGYLAVFSERATLERPVLYLLGVCSSAGLICFHLESLVLRFPAFWMQIAVRVLGSWIAAIGLLVAVLEATGAARAAG